MGDLIHFPKPEPEKFTPPAKGYCSTCRIEVEWPQTYAWPESCPNGCTPLILTSWLPEPMYPWSQSYTN